MLGHHFSLSAMKLKGARYLRAAGDRASAAYAIRTQERDLTRTAAHPPQPGRRLMDDET